MTDQELPKVYTGYILSHTFDSVFEDVAKEVDGGTVGDVIHVDFSKLFDKVPYVWLV